MSWMYEPHWPENVPYVLVVAGENILKCDPISYDGWYVCQLSPTTFGGLTGGACENANDCPNGAPNVAELFVLIYPVLRGGSFLRHFARRF